MSNCSTKVLMNVGVMAVGNAGEKIVNNFIKSYNDHDYKFIFANTTFDSNNYDVDATRITLSNPSNSIVTTSIDKLVSVELINEIKESLKDIKLLILCAGFGGKVGTNYLPLIAKIAKDMDIVTVSILNTPFSYEGNEKSVLASKTIDELKGIIDSAIIISSNKLMNNYPDITASDSFKLINNVEKNCIKSIINLFSTNSNTVIDLSASELMSIIKEKGEMYVGFGSGMGRNKISRAVNRVFNSKIIDYQVRKADNAILYIVGDSTVTISQINEIIETFKMKLKKDNVNVIFKFDINQNLVNEIQISLFANSNQLDQNLTKTKNEKMLYDSQELLIKIGDTLENELSMYSTGELAIPKSSYEKDSYEIDDKDQANKIITSNETDDDDIPFFLK